ncbi:Uu.00g051190.m01.CDS01 [Anthostomella pinea]|uniref:Uu.00g051190.m01.CDS01 n=1 Tax=Anthostomella pinea TaxID=933095 RepID=A0AAI8VST5_9PEZI|nr:Uu.00g051190.m01.CDS01 [Anthostomella pinea]
MLDQIAAVHFNSIENKIEATAEAQQIANKEMMDLIAAIKETPNRLEAKFNDLNGRVDALLTSNGIDPKKLTP